MAKKYKRSVTATPLQREETTSGNLVEKAGGMFARRGAGVVEFNPDYSYIIKDLKRIGILAGSFFVILVALSFILNR
jgi:hypothetical protein